MAKDVSQHEQFKHPDIQRKFAGELLIEYLKDFYLAMPKISFILSFLMLLSIAISPSFALFSQVCFVIGLVFIFTSVIFTYMVVEERADEACIGVINTARGSQFKELFSLSKKPIKYYANIGYAVYNFLGKDRVEALKYNLTRANIKYQMLVEKVIYTMGYLMPGSTGSGKTVTLNSTAFLPAIQTGNGFFYIEGKGDRPITEVIMAFIYQYGREHDVFILDFGAAASGGKTNGLNPLAIGNSKTVGELLKNLIDIMKGDNKWVSDMAIAFLEALLLPLVLLRDLNYVVKPSELQKIKTFSDLKTRETFEFNITSLLNYLNFQAAIDLYYMMGRMLNDKQFLAEVKKHPEYRDLQRDLHENILGRLKRNLTGHNIPVSLAVEPDYVKDIAADVKRNHPKATEDWINALETFGSEKFYGNIFNKDNADFSPLTAIQQGKIIISIIPSMSASEDQCKKMGQMLTSVAKSSIGYMIERGDLMGTRRDKRRNLRYRPRKLPYAYIFDEPSNYASADIAQMSSMVRSIGSDGGGMAIFWTGQAKQDADKIDDGKKLVSQQMLANMGLTQSLNIGDEGWQDFMAKKCGEHYVWIGERYDGRRDDKDESYRTLTRTKEKKYEANYFEANLRPQTGESIVVVKGYAKEEKVVAPYNPAPLSDLRININISYKQLFKTFKTDEQIVQELKKIEEQNKQVIEENLLKKDGLTVSYQEEVHEMLSIIGSSCYPALEKVNDFTLSLLSEKNPRAHGDYNTKTYHINIYNAINKPREHLVATAIHELVHHVENMMHGDTGHSKRFYKYLHELLAKGMELGMIDYAMAREQNMIDANDIRMLEKYFGPPKMPSNDNNN